MDFNSSNITGTFPASDSFRDEIQTSIPIINDDINEVNQFFVVRLELVNATNPERVNIQSRPLCQCEIADEDSKCSH